MGREYEKQRKNDDWFVGTITNNRSRQLSIPLNFLSDGNYTAEIYADAPDADKNPNHLIKQTRTVTKQDFIQVNLAAGGGEVIHLRKQ